MKRRGISVKSSKQTAGKNQDRGEKKNTSLRLDSGTLKSLKIKAIEDDTSVQKVLEKLVKGYIKGKYKLEK